MRDRHIWRITSILSCDTPPTSGGQVMTSTKQLTTTRASHKRSTQFIATIPEGAFDHTHDQLKQFYYHQLSDKTYSPNSPSKRRIYPNCHVTHAPTLAFITIHSWVKSLTRYLIRFFQTGVSYTIRLAPTGISGLAQLEAPFQSVCLFGQSTTT